MDIESLSLQDLAESTGVEPRTIRSYVERGIIPGPESLGRGARYPRESLERLQVFQLLRDANRDLSVDQIRLLMQGLTPGVIADLAAGRQQIAAVIDTDAAAPLRQKGAALEYLRNLGHAKTNATRSPGGPADRSRAGGRSAEALSAPPSVDPSLAAPPASPPSSPPAFTHHLSTGAPQDSPPDLHLHVLERAAKALAALVGGSSPARSARGESWYRIRLTPDIELSVRGEFPPEQRAQFHRIADALKLLLTKGAKS